MPFYIVDSLSNFSILLGFLLELILVFLQLDLEVDRLVSDLSCDLVFYGLVCCVGVDALNNEIPDDLVLSKDIVFEFDDSLHEMLALPIIGIDLLHEPLAVDPPPNPLMLELIKEILILDILLPQ